MVLPTASSKGIGTCTPQLRIGCTSTGHVALGRYPQIRESDLRGLETDSLCVSYDLRARRRQES